MEQLLEHHSSAGDVEKISVVLLHAYIIILEFNALL